MGLKARRRPRTTLRIHKFVKKPQGIMALFRGPAEECIHCGQPKSAGTLYCPPDDPPPKP